MSKVKNLYNFTIGKMKSVEEFDRSKHYVKVINIDKKHFEMEYKEGLNIDVMPFNDNPKASCVEGGIYFTTLEYLPEFCDYGTLVAEIKIPESARIVLDPEGNKYRADKIEILKFWDIEEFLNHVTYIEITCDINGTNFNNTDMFNELVKVKGNMDFENVMNCNGLNNLIEVDGHVYFEKLENLDGLKNIKEISGSANFNNVKSINGLSKLKRVGWYADFSNLDDFNKLENLNVVDGYLYIKKTNKDFINNTNVSIENIVLV